MGGEWGQWTTWQCLWALNTHIHTLLFTFCDCLLLFPLHSNLLVKRKASGASPPSTQTLDFVFEQNM